MYLLGSMSVILISSYEDNLVCTWLLPCIHILVHVVFKVLDNCTLIISHLIKRT